MAQRSTLTKTEGAFVRRLRVARLATADEQGNPTLVPVCYTFDDTCFYTPLDQKPKSVPGTKLRRVRNIEVRPTVALLIDQYTDDDWSQLGYVQVHGQAVLVAPGDERHGRALTLLRARYEQYRTMELERYPVIMITPQRVTSWGIARGE